MAITYTIPGISLSGNPIRISVTTTAPDMVDKPNYKLALKITCSDLMGSPFIEEIAPLNFISEFDISGFVDQPVGVEFQFPAQGVSGSNESQQLEVTIDIGEVYIDANGERVSTWLNIAENNQIRVLKGKLRPYELSILNEENKTFYTEYVSTGRFLTHLPDKQKVSPTQIVKLWFMSHFDVIKNATWNCRITAETATIVSDFDITGECILYPGTGLMEFNINPAFMGFDEIHDPKYKRLSYKFWLSDETEHLSETREFIIDNRYYEKSHIFYYVNPLSAIDCIWLTGEYIEGLTTESEIAYRTLPTGSGTKIASLKTISASGQVTRELNTGSKSRDEMIALRDFIESKDRWLVDPDNPTRLIPVIVETGDFKLYDSLENIQNFIIKILEAHKS